MLNMVVHLYCAGINGGTGGGIQAYVYTNPSAKSIEYQKAFYNELIKLTI